MFADPFRCGVCDRKFGNRTALNAHERTHDRARDISTIQSCRDDARFEAEAEAREGTNAERDAA